MTSKSFSMTMQIIIACIIISFTRSQAQQWDGAQDFINPIFRVGKVGIGFSGEPHSDEILTLSGAILIGNAAGSEPGTIQWDSKNFMGFRGGEWVLLNSFGGMNQNHIYSLNSGNVGIGTTSPVAKLDINGTLRTNNTISLVNGATTYLNFTTTNSYFNGGNVGIGTITPTAKLHIHQSSTTNWTDGFFLSRQAGGGPVGTYMLQKTDGFYIKSSGDYNFMTADGNDQLMKISTNGNLTIGNSTSLGQLIMQTNYIPTNWDNGIYFLANGPVGHGSSANIKASDWGLTMWSPHGYTFYNSTGTEQMFRIAYDAITHFGTGSFQIAASTQDPLSVVNINANSSLVGNITLGYYSSPPPPPINEEEEGMLVNNVFLTANGTSYIKSVGLAIGKINVIPGYKLDVDGKIRANEIVVTTGGADFVFENDYNLKSLDEVETFIKENKHLPDIPTAKEVEENGVSLGEMQIKLLQKIEELTLYIIEQEKRIRELESEQQIR